MTYVLHGAPGSGSGIVELGLLTIGVDFELRDLDARGGEHRGAPYTALNPNQKMPTLVTPEGEVLTESAAIVLTLDERFPQACLLPPVASAERARALRWMIFFVSELYPLVELIDHPERFDPDHPSALRVRATERWMERWAQVEAALDGRPWALGGSMSALDFYVSVLGRWIEDAQWRARALPKVEASRAALRAQTSLAAAVRRHHL